MAKEEVWIRPDREMVVPIFFVDSAMALKDWLNECHPEILEEFSHYKLKQKELDG